MSPHNAPSFWRSVLLRAAIFLALWLVLTLGNPADLPAGILASIAATWTSLYLLPVSEVRLSLPESIKFALHFSINLSSLAWMSPGEHLIRAFHCDQVKSAFNAGWLKVPLEVRFARLHVSYLELCRRRQIKVA